MKKELLQDSAGLFMNLTEDCVRSISEMQVLKSEILKNNLFATDQNEKEEILLLIDAIIWEEIHAADKFRKERKENLMEISNLRNRVQERENKP